MQIERLYEDDDLMVLEKPAGVVVNQAETVQGKTMQDWFVSQFAEIVERQGDDELFAKRLGMVHRLDKDTSGCLLWAKNVEVLRELMGQFKRREVKKEYLALVHGRLEPGEGVIKLPIRRDKQDREKWAVGYDGKQAETGWRVTKRLRGKYEYSLVELWPKTGRTHQIRVHMNHLGHALVADEKYLKKSRWKENDEKLKRQFLHASKIEFCQPNSDEMLSVSSQLPDELEGFLAKLEVIN